jgi:hypothetical protein
LVVKLDKGAKQSQVKNGYKLLVGFAMSMMHYSTLFITSLQSSLGAFAVSGALMAFQKVMLTVMCPGLKRCCGECEKKCGRTYFRQ